MLIGEQAKGDWAIGELFICLDDGDPILNCWEGDPVLNWGGDLALIWELGDPTLNLIDDCTNLLFVFWLNFDSLCTKFFC